MAPPRSHTDPQVLGFSSCFERETPTFCFLGQFWHFFPVRPGVLLNIREMEKSFCCQPRGRSSLRPAGPLSPDVSFSGWRRKAEGIHSLPASLFCPLTPNWISSLPHKKALAVGELMWPALHVKGIYLKDDRNQQDGCPYPVP